VYWTRTGRPAKLNFVDAITTSGGSTRVFTAYVIVTAVTIMANVSAAVADLARAGFVLATMREVGVPRSWLVPLGLLKGAGAAGLLLGLLGLRSLGTAAALGLVAFFAGALITHVRARVFHNIAFPAAFFALATATAATALAVAAR
jgi:DoxX-like family